MRWRGARRSRTLVAIACCTLLASSCASGGGTRMTAAGDGNGPPTGELVVLAASSLTEPFEALAAAFEVAHPGVEVRFSFAGTTDLARQIDAGAPADVFASADEETMRGVVAAGHAEAPVVFARNRLALMVERGNPKGIRTLADAARPGVVLVVCAPQAPCGRLAAAAFRAVGVTAKPASFEANAKAVVAKVTLGEADAGVVYRSDVRAAGEAAEGIDLGAGAAGLHAVYPVAVTTTAANRAVARAWVDLVVSARGRQVLTAAGFLTP